MNICGEFLSLQVPGLAEGRPSLLLGDKVVVSLTGLFPMSFLLCIAMMLYVTKWLVLCFHQQIVETIQTWQVCVCTADFIW